MSELLTFLVFFFFKQKTAYEMRISDWSSDVCSSDLTQGNAAFYTEADSLYKNATDPASSTISDTVGFAQFPAGEEGSHMYNVPSWALGIAADRKSVV